MTEYEDSHETQVAEICVKRILGEEIFVKGLFEFPCANGTLKRPGRPRLSLFVEGKLRQEGDDGIEVSDKKESDIKDSWSMSGDFIYRHHEEPLSNLCEPDDETFTITLKNVDVMRQTKKTPQQCL